MSNKISRSAIGMLSVVLVLCLFAVVLIGELFSIQIVQGTHYKKLAGANHFTKRQTYPERGKIEDTNGETLALTTYVYTIGITPATVRSNKAKDPPKREAIIDAFSKFLKLERSEVTRCFAKKDVTYVVLKKNISKEEYDPFAAYLNENRINGVAVDALPRRFYPKKDVASQVIGFAGLNERSLVGINGVEAYYNKILSGTPGYTYGEVDHYFGGQLPYTTPTETKPIPGSNLVLNIDSKLQREIQKIVTRYSNLFEAIDGATGLVMDTKTGAVLAMAQDVSYDLNHPYQTPRGYETGARAVKKERIVSHGYDLAELEKGINKQIEQLKKEEEDRKKEVEAARLDAAKEAAAAAEAQKKQTADRDGDAPKTNERNVSSSADFASPTNPSNRPNMANPSGTTESAKPAKPIVYKQKFGPTTPHKFLGLLYKNFATWNLIEELKEPNPNYKGWSPLTDKYDMNFLNSHVWANLNVSSTYEPGSTMKSFTVATALEEHAFKLGEMFSDAPIWIRGFGEYAIHCHAFPDNHAYETVEQAYGNSCNPVMVQLAERVGIEKFYNYIHALGFYGTTGVDLPAEASGLLHNNPNVVDLAPMSFGESNTVTPLALATAYTALGNEGVMMKPQVAKYLTDVNGKIVREFAPCPVRQVYSKETAKTMLAMMRSAFTKGIVTYANEPGYFPGGKSGTSTKKLLNGDDDDYSVMSVASVFPIDEPRFVVLAIIYGPNSDKTSCAQGMCRDIIRVTGRLRNIAKRYTEADLYQAIQPKEISYANGIKLQSIADYLALKDVEFELAPGMKYSDFFYTMYPLGKQKLNGYPVYYVSPNGDPPREEVDVPDFTGKTFEEAAELAYQRRINIRYDGNPLTGVVVGQSVEAKKDGKRQKIRKYEVVELKFGALPGYNPPQIRRVVDPPVTKSNDDGPAVTDPIWTTQRIYSPYGGVPEHNPYGG